MGTFSLTNILNLMWNAVTGVGGGTNFMTVFQGMAAVFWGFMAFIMFSKEAMDLAAGRGFNLDKKLIRYAVLGILLFTWPTIATKLYGFAVYIVHTYITDQGTLTKTIIASYHRMSTVDKAAWDSGGVFTRIWMVLTAIPNMIMTGALSVIGGLILIFCYILILLMVVGAFTVFAMHLLLGPIFLALGLSSEFEQYMWRWVGALLTYVLVIPLYGAALEISVAIFSAGLPNFRNIQGAVSLDHLFVSIVGPIIAVGIVFATSKVATSLTGGVMASTGSLAMSVGLAVAGIAAKAAAGGGGAAAAGGGAAAGGAGKAASAGVDAVGTGASGEKSSEAAKEG